jgi:alkanesulfonate monooxygenase SsuD/methylene tetrahydromethanopterin reductase-like flavin-dependent oxidoreductase (luciferase family)
MGPRGRLGLVAAPRPSATTYHLPPSLVRFDGEDREHLDQLCRYLRRLRLTEDGRVLLELAKIAASVDLISRGRLTLGIGAGFFEEEYKQYGWEFPPPPAIRIRQMEEAVQLILKMWTEPRTTFHGRYFHVEDAILEPKPVQKPRPPVMIAGGGEQMTLRAVARLADACNLVDGDIADVRHKLAVRRGHSDSAGRDYDTIEKTRIQPWLLARDAATLAAKREQLAARGPLRGFVGTVSEAIDLIGQYQDAGVDLLIHADRRNDVETRELFVSDVMPHFAFQ